MLKTLQQMLNLDNTACDKNSFKYQNNQEHANKFLSNFATLTIFNLATLLLTETEKELIFFRFALNIECLS